MITDKSIKETVDIGLRAEGADKVYSLIFGSKEFTPSALMARTLAEYITQEDNLLPHQILIKNGRARENWYIWSKRPGFLAWWNGVIEGVFSKQRLGDLYNALYRRGLSNDTAAAKICLQRFDPKYTERSSQDQRLAFAGYEPGMVEDSQARMQAAIADEKALQAPPGTYADDKVLLPDGTVRPYKALPAAPVPEQGPAHSLPAPEPAQAQTPSQEHVAGMDAALDKDNIIDSEPISKVSTPGGGFGE